MDKIDLLISELRSRNIRGTDNINAFIEVKLSFKEKTEFYRRLQDSSENVFTFSVSRWIAENCKEIIKDPDDLISILKSRLAKGYSLDQTVCPLQELDTSDLFRVYNSLRDSNNNENKTVASFFLGEIGIRSPKFLSEEILNFSSADDEKRISLIQALRMSANRVRNRNFSLTEDDYQFIACCTRSDNNELACEAIYTSILIFEHNTGFKQLIEEFFYKSNENRLYVFKCLDQQDLSDQDFEFELLKNFDINSIEEIKTLMWILSSKIFRSGLSINKYLDKTRLQNFCLEFIHKVFTQLNIENQQQLTDSELLTKVGDLDIEAAYNYLLAWIANETVNPDKHRYIYSKVLEGVFENHEMKFIHILSV